MNIGIAGAGLAGMAAARVLTAAGHQVTICEKMEEPGGLAGTFAYEGTRLEKFYHHYFTTDLNTVNLLKDLGLEEKMIWKETPMGVYTQGKLYKFSTPMDLLRFKPLSVFNRLRFGVVTLWLSRVKNWEKYEHQPAGQWIRKWYGRQAWDVVWGPLLHSKFGDHAEEIGMPWFYSRIHTRAGSRAQGMTKESLGYVQGSFQVMHEALRQDIEARGGSFHFRSEIKNLMVENNKIKGWRTERGEETFDAVLLTMAPQIITGLLPAGCQGTYWDRVKQIDYYGNVCAVLTLKHSLTPIYWMNIPDLNSPFIAVIEHTNFIGPEAYQGKHVLYLSSYLDVNHPRYKADDQTVLSEFYAYLKKILPQFSEDDVLEHHLFRTPYAQPIMRTGYGEQINPIATPVAGLYVANMGQVYPEDRGMSYSLRLGEQAAAVMLKALK